MKKIMALLFSLLLVAAFALGCKKAEAPKPAEAPAPAAPAAPATPAPAPAAPAGK